MENTNTRRPVSTRLALSSRRALLYGAIAGFIATWSISTAIAASEIELGLPVSTFYAIMALSLGAADPMSAAYLGFGLHLATGTILGGGIGVLAVSIERMRKSTMENILNPYRATAMGIGTGILVWLVLFMPATFFFIQPSENRIVGFLSTYAKDPNAIVGISPEFGQSFRGIAISAILFHAVWGAIFGFIINSLSRIRLAALHDELAGKSPYSLTGRGLRVALFGLAAGMIGAMAISGLLLLAEKVSSLPVGTFYYVLVSGLTGLFSSNVQGSVALGIAIHLAAGSVMGLIISVPYIANAAMAGGSADKRKSFFMKYGPVYGLASGFAIWVLLFMPFTYLAVVPILNSFENQDVYVGQRVPTGELASATFFRLTTILDQIVYVAIVFNIFFGLLVGILCQSFSQKYLTLARSKPSNMVSNTDNARNSG